MIVCPVCSRGPLEATVRPPGLACRDCGASFPREGEIQPLLPPPEPERVVGTFDASVLGVIARHNVHHWWYEGRRDLIARSCHRHLPTGARILEVGCGEGDLLSHLRGEGFDVAGAELLREGLDGCLRRPHGALFQCDANRLPFREEFDAVALFDVLEHLDDDEAAVRACAAAVRPGGVVMFTVPAFDVLWGIWDDWNGHRRRYRRSQMIRLLRRAGLSVAEARYFWAVLFPPMLAVRLAKRAGSRLGVYREPDSAEGWREGRTGPRLHRLMMALFRMETALGAALPWPFGGSLLVVGRRPEATGR